MSQLECQNPKLNSEVITFQLAEQSSWPCNLIEGSQTNNSIIEHVHLLFLTISYYSGSRGPNLDRVWGTLPYTISKA